MRIAIVFNPKSGRRAAAYAVGQVVSALASHNHELEVIDCVAQPDFEHALRDQAHALDRVIVVGGDGTLNAAVNAIATSTNPHLPLAFVPTGRGKDTARSLASWKPGSLADGAFEQAELVPTDLIRISLENGVERFAINVSSIGMSGHAVQVANKVPRLFGSLAYVIGAGRSLTPPRPFALSMQVDGERVEIDNALLIAACNGKTFGGGIFIAPESDQRDGILDIVVAHNANLGDLALQLGKLKSGKPFDHPALSRWKAQMVTVEPIPPVLSEADGELLSSQPIRFEIAPQALNWVTP